MKRAAATAALVVWGILVVTYAVSHRPDLGTAYGVGQLFGALGAVALIVYGVNRMWFSGERGDQARGELKSHPVPYALGALILVGVVIVIVAAGGTGSSGARKPASRPDVEAVAFEAGFIKSCSSSLERSVCECEARYVVEQAGYDTRDEILQLGSQFEVVSRTRNPADVPPVLTDAAANCVKA